MAIYKMIPRPAYPLVLAMLWLAAGTAAAQPSDFERFVATFRELPDGPLPTENSVYDSGDTLTTQQVEQFFWQPYLKARRMGKTFNRFDDQLPCRNIDLAQMHSSTSRSIFFRVGKRSVRNATVLFYVNNLGMPGDNILAVVHSVQGDVLDMLMVQGNCGACIMLYYYSAELTHFPNGDLQIIRGGSRFYEAGVTWPGVEDLVSCELCQTRETFTLNASGTLALKANTVIGFVGEFLDATTGEGIVLGNCESGPRAAYRSNARKPWSFPAITHIDRPGRSLTIRFSNSPTTYHLVQSPDGQTLTSTGSDGSAPQVFRRVRPAP